MKFLSIIILAALLALGSCGKNPEQVPEKETKLVADSSNSDKYPLLVEAALSHWNDSDNVDSPALWMTPDGDTWIIATTKSTHQLIIYDENGETLDRQCKPGSGKNELMRPNGIWVLDNYCFVVERDNHRVQIFELPGFTHRGFIGEDKLTKPYGMAAYRDDSGNIQIYITDAYEIVEDEIPADSLLGKRVLHYELSNQNTENADWVFDNKFIRYIGATEGEGTIKIPESIYADPTTNTLMIAEEYEPITSVLVYSLDEGKYVKTLGSGLFRYQSEGIALYDCGEGKGYWFFTDQDEGDNTFHIYDRETHDYITSFKSETTQNTDGVWLAQVEPDGYPMGIFIPVHDDGGIGIFSIEKLFEELKLKCK